MTSTLAIALLGLCLLPSPQQEELRFQAQNGLILHKHFQLDSVTKLDLMSVEAAGKPQGTSLQMNLTVHQELQVTDSYLQATAGIPTEVERSFEAIVSRTNATLSTPVLGPQMMQVSGSSPLLGQRILHARPGIGSTWTHSLEPESKLPPSTIYGLHYDLDFASLLPRGKVQVADSWSVPATLINACLAPAGDLKLTLQADDASALQLPASALAPVLAPLEGQVSATLMALEENEGQRVAHIALAFQVNCTQDLTAKMAALLKMGTGPGGIEMQSTVQSYGLKWSYQGTGSALWDLERGHLISLTLEGMHHQSVDSNLEVMAAGIRQPITNHMEMSGSTRAKITFTP